MRTETIQIQLQGKATGAVLQTYFMDASKELLNSTRRPAVLLMPGGAYPVSYTHLKKEMYITDNKHCASRRMQRSRMLFL